MSIHVMVINPQLGLSLDARRLWNPLLPDTMTLHRGVENVIKGGMTTIYVSDMDRAVDFYAKTLNLRVTYRAGNEWCGLDAGDGLKLGLHPASSKAPPPGTNGATIVGFGITQPIDDVVAALSQKGVTFKGPIIDDADGSIRLAYFTDPDGNELYLCESKWQPT